MKILPYFDYILKDIPVFSGLTEKEMDRIKKKARVTEFKKNQIIYREGSVPSNFYCIIRGRVVITTQDKSGKHSVLEYLHRGKYFGIISILTGEPHSVTAKAINDCLLLTIKKEDFEGLMKKIPKLAIDLSRTLSRRLKRKDVHQKTIFESTIISVLSSYPQSGKTVYASNLALSINKEAHKRVIILDICPEGKIYKLPGVLGSGREYKIFNLSGRKVHLSGFRDYIKKDSSGIDVVYLLYKSNSTGWTDVVVDILSFMVNDYHYIILDLPSLKEKAILNILNQSDKIHILTTAKSDHLKSTGRLISRLENDYYFPKNKIKVILNESKSSGISFDEKTRILNHEIFADLPKVEAKTYGRVVLEKPDEEYSKVIRRISRQEGDCIVGLALGVGVAYGFCHIGVLKVIEEEKIPVDVIAGSSMGAFIASLWCLGKTSQEILEVVKEFKQPKNIWALMDFTFPLMGFIKGQRLYNFLKRHLGNKTFYDVKVPLKIIASDIKMKQTRILDKGTIIDAIMASCSMPGVFTPFKMKEEILFDGGVINPLPTEPLFEIGVKKIIAVSLTPSKEDIDRQYDKLKAEIKANPKIINKEGWFNLKRFLKEKFKTNILDYIFSSFEIMQYEVAQKEAQLADVVLHPDTSGLHWVELHKAEEFARRGEEEARKKLDAIRKMINE